MLFSKILISSKILNEMHSKYFGEKIGGEKSVG